MQIFNVLGEHFHSGKFSQWYVCFVSHNFPRLSLQIDTLITFFQMLEVADIDTVNQKALQAKARMNTFGLYLRIIIAIPY